MSDGRMGMHKIPIYYINMSSAPKRRAQMERQLLGLNLTATRVEGVTPKDISPQDLHEFCNPDRYGWIAPEELACGLSHLKVWREVLRAGVNCALVLEDDAILSGRLPEFLSAFPGSPHIIKLEVTAERLRASHRPTLAVAGVDLLKVFGFSGGAAGYIIPALVASRLVDGSEVRRTSIDRALFDSFSRSSSKIGYLQASPALIAQANFLGGRDVEPSALTPGSERREATKSHSRGIRLKNYAIWWYRNNIIAGLQRAYLDLRGFKKKEIEFAP